MQTISLCMIVKDEEEALARCLDCVQGIADEIVIVDTGSQDRTREIAKRYTGKVYDFEWVDDFSAARNFSFEKATMDYILWLDADDVLLDEDRFKFMQLKKDLNENVDFVMMRYVTQADSSGRPTYFNLRERLVKRSCGFKWSEPVHECLLTGGNILNSDICVTHQKIREKEKGRNLEIYERLFSQGKELSARGLYYYARELKDNGRIDEATQKFNLFLMNPEGWAEDKVGACYQLAQCYSDKKLYDLALAALLNSFIYDLPRAEGCCRIGYAFMEKKEYRKAAFWFELALTVKTPLECPGFMHPDYSDYIPLMELAVCYDRLGESEKAEAFNNRAGIIKPDSPSFLYNQKYFATLKNKKSNNAI